MVISFPLTCVIFIIQNILKASLPGYQDHAPVYCVRLQCCLKGGTQVCVGMVSQRWQLLGSTAHAVHQDHNGIW